MEWKPIFRNYFYILLFHLRISHGLKNCSNFNGSQPKIIIHQFGGNNHLPPGSVEDNPSSFQRKQIECVHTSPIEWVVDIDPENSDMRRNLYWKRLNLGEPNKTEYSVYMVFMYTPSKLKHPVLFSCQLTNLKDECERQFLEVTPGKFAPTFSIANLPSSSKYQELGEKLHSSVQPIGNKSYADCEITLNLKELEENYLEYKWELRPGNKLQTEVVKSTRQPTYFRGMYRNVKQERNCVKLLGQNETCENCIKVIPDESETQLNSVTFYAKSDLQELVFKGVFNLSTDQNSNRKFYLDWDLPLEEMIYVEVPSKFYVNHTVTVNCTVSVLYFAYGTIIVSEGEKESFIDPHLVTIQNGLIKTIDHNETYRDGGRITSKHFTFSEENSHATVNCLAPLLNFTRRISKSKTVPVEIPIAPNFNGSFVNEVETLHLENGEIGRTLSCEVSGNPVPATVEWKFPSKEIKNKIETRVNSGNIETIKSEISFPTLTSEFVGTYNCVASNDFGTISKAFSIQIPSEVLSQGAKIGIGSGFGIMSLIFIVIVFIIYRKIILQRQEYRTKTAEAIEEFKKGTSKREGDSEERKRQHHKSIFEQPYNDEYEIPSEKWVIEDKFLGQGAFGFVRKGSVEVEGKIVQVAVKMLKCSVEIEDFKSFLFELKIMAYIGHHPNIVSLVAACTQNIEQRDVMIGVEFCSNGSLMDYLVKKKGLYQALIYDNSGGAQGFATMKATYENLINTITLTELDLYIWCYQIANGMEFLGNKKVLHGDLATRNVLLSFDKTAKISDFGLSRVLLDSSNYTKKSRVPLPWKWMAIESLRFMQFSSSSDVWAFGVTVWEIFSLGEAPYAGLHYSQEFIQQLDQGLRLTNPTRATEHTYDIMMKCWSKDPSERISFSELKSAFAQILNRFNDPSSSNEMPSRPLNRSPVPLPRTRNEQVPLNITELYANISRNENFYLNG